jgi:magnesium transporter
MRVTTYDCFMIKKFYNTKRTPELKELDEYVVGSWIHVEKPNQGELDELVEKFDLDEGLLADATDQYEVPRVERYEGKTYVFTRIPYKEDKTVYTVPILIILSDENLITVTQREVPLWNRFFQQRIPFYTTQRINFFFQIFTEITVQYDRFMTQIRKNVQASTTSFGNISNQSIVDFVRFESTLNNFLSALVPTNVVLKNLLSGKFLKLYEEDKELVEDVLLLNEQLIESCRSNLKAISNIRDAYSTIMTNNLNRIIKLLTALTIVFTIPTMIASFFGMNVPLPGGQHPLMFWWILGSALLVSVIIFILFYYKNWLQ